MEEAKLTSVQINIPELFEIQNGFEIIERRENNPHILDEIFTINGFNVDPKYSRKEIINQYSHELRKKPLFFGLRFDKDSSTFVSEFSELFAGSAMALGFLFAIAVFMRYIMELQQQIALRIFGVLSAIIIVTFLVLFLKGSTRSLRLFYLKYSFIKQLDDYYKNDDWLTLKSYYFEIEEWFKNEHTRYTKLTEAFNKYKANDVEAMPEHNIFFKAEDKEDTKNMIISFEKNIDCSLRLWAVISHALAYIIKQMGTFEAEKTLLKTREKYVDIERIYKSIENIRDHQDNKRHLNYDEILFTPIEVEIIDAKLNEFDGLV